MYGQELLVGGGGGGSSLPPVMASAAEVAASAVIRISCHRAPGSSSLVMLYYFNLQDIRKRKRLSQRSINSRSVEGINMNFSKPSCYFYHPDVIFSVCVNFYNDDTISR